MKAKIILSFITAIAAFTIATGQPMIPVSNISPVPANTLIGGPATGVSGRARTILAGDGITIANGTINATGGGGGGAPTNATYITQTPNATLTNEQPLSLLATGLLKSTTGTGVITIATPNTDYISGVTPGTSGNVLTSNGTAWTSAAASGGAGNVTAAGTLDSGNIVIGQGTKAVATSSTFSISGSNATVTGNLAITGGTTFNNLTTTNLSVTGNITATGVGNGTLLIGNATGTKFDVATLTAGDGVTITNGAGAITINATGGAGNVTGSGLTANAIVIGAGSNAVQIGPSPGTSGNVVTSNGTAWISAVPTSGSGTVNSGTAGQMAYYATSTTAVSGAVVPKLEVAATNNLSAYTFYNVFQYPFAKTDTSLRNVMGIVSNDASNPFGIAFSFTGHGSTASSRIARMVIGGVGASELGQFQVSAYQTDFLTQELLGNVGLRITTTDALSTLSHQTGNGSMHIKPGALGYVNIGAADYSPLGSYGVYNAIKWPFAKTDTTARNAVVISSNDASNPFALVMNVTGNATAANRVFQMSVGAIGTDNAGELRLGGTKVTQYYDAAGTLTLMSTVDSTGITVAGDVTTSTIGKTLKVKSGSNAKAGTVTLASGAGTVSSTAITANSVICFGLKTASGAITAQPYCTAVSVGTSYTVAAGAGDNSTYSWIILEVN